MSGRHSGQPRTSTGHRRSSPRSRFALPSVLLVALSTVAGALLALPIPGSGPDAAELTAGRQASVLSGGTAPRPVPAPEPEAPPVQPAPAAQVAARPAAKPAPARATPEAARARTNSRRASRSEKRGENARVDGPCRVTDAARDYPNGRVPEDSLCDLPQDRQKLHTTAANAFWRLNGAYRDEFGKNLCVSSSYRTFEEQASLRKAKPGLAAKAGTSNHGWGLAVDLCGGIDNFGTPQYRWMADKAGEFGFENPSWARQGGSKPEPWHWEYAPGL
jgi:zinc D-Ala-D-Ala carboxypeptidase